MPGLLEIRLNTSGYLKKKTQDLSRRTRSVGHNEVWERVGNQIAGVFHGQSRLSVCIRLVWSPKTPSELRPKHSAEPAPRRVPNRIYN